MAFDFFCSAVSEPTSAMTMMVTERTFVALAGGPWQTKTRPNARNKETQNGQ
jgi:hypothetical protein